MIYGELKELKFYKGISENLDKAIEYIEKGEYKNGVEGKNEIDGDKVFFNFQNADIRKEEEAFFEGHKKYIDIQLVIEGEELIGYTSRSNVVRTSSWDAEKDFEVYEGSIEHRFVLNEDTFIILFPEEPHMPLLESEKGFKKVKKAVFKVLY